jgi:uncharacterized membrane protein YoaK (UPF0700 family)
MFRHRGKRRTYIHNLNLAAMLSFIAGMVNVSGVLAVKVLTTNVTGHFAYFSEELTKEQYFPAFEYLLFIFSFLSGAFLSNFLIELAYRIRPRISHTTPLILEILILGYVGFWGTEAVCFTYATTIACLLLFAMGMQNAMVTKVSDSVVRTTHLTGLFTDLGIELSQLFFYRQQDERKKLSKNVYLRLMIILCFFLGCVLGGYLFTLLSMKTLCLASVILLNALFYDTIRYRYYLIRRKKNHDPFTQ